MSNAWQATAPSAPPRHDIECRVFEVVCDTLGHPRHAFTFDSDILTDFGGDSLDVIGLFMSIEETFAIRLSDQALQSFFVNRHFSVRNIAELVLRTRGADPGKRRVPALEEAPEPQLV